MLLVFQIDLLRQLVLQLIDVVPIPEAVADLLGDSVFEPPCVLPRLVAAKIVQEDLVARFAGVAVPHVRVAGHGAAEIGSLLAGTVAVGYCHRLALVEGRRRLGLDLCLRRSNALLPVADQRALFL